MFYACYALYSVGLFLVFIFCKIFLHNMAASKQILLFLCFMCRQNQNDVWFLHNTDSTPIFIFLMINISVLDVNIIIVLGIYSYIVHNKSL